MTDWIPEVSVISKEQAVILDLIKLCKKEMVYHRATIQTLQILGHQGQSALAGQIADEIKAAAGVLQRDVDVIFRPVESALAHAEAYLQILQELLSKQLSRI